MTSTKSPLELFYSYAHEDEELRDELEKHLSLLKRQGIITDWHDREITGGSAWKDRVDEHLESAHIILLLVSSDFLASDYCYDIEMKRALERHEKNEAMVIPVILRPVDWHGAPFGKLQALPKDAKPVKRWPDQDEAFLDIAKGIRKAAETIRGPAELKDNGSIVSSPTPFPGASPPTEIRKLPGILARKIWGWLTETNTRKLVFISSIIAAIGSGGWQIYICLSNLNVAIEQITKGEKLLNIGQYVEAKQTFQQALNLSPRNPQASWGLKKAAVWDLPDSVFEQEIRNLYQENPNDPHINLFWGIFHASRHETQEAIRYYEAAIKLNPSLAEAYFGLGVLYDHQGKMNEAETIYKKAVAVSQSTPKYRNNLAYLYFKQQHYEKSIEEYGKNSQFPLSTLEIAKIYGLLGNLGRARDYQQQAVQWLNDEAIMTKPENREPWYFEVGNEGIELYDLNEKKCYAYYSLSAILYLLGQAKEAEQYVQMAHELGAPHKASIINVLNYDLERLIEKNASLAQPVEAYRKRFL